MPRYKGGRLRRECLHCGGVFFPYESAVKRRVGKHCSTECRDAALRTLPDVECEYCGETFRWKGGSNGHVGRFCTHEHYVLWLREHLPPRERLIRKTGKRSPGWIGLPPLDDLIRYWNGRCAYCMREVSATIEAVPWQAHRDHFIPLSRGGIKDMSNLVIACRQCNMSKSNRHPIEWMTETFGKHHARNALQFITAQTTFAWWPGSEHVTFHGDGNMLTVPTKYIDVKRLLH